MEGFALPLGSGRGPSLHPNVQGYLRNILRESRSDVWGKDCWELGRVSGIKVLLVVSKSGSQCQISVSPYPSVESQWKTEWGFHCAGHDWGALSPSWQHQWWSQTKTAATANRTKISQESSLAAGVTTGHPGKKVNMKALRSYSWTPLWCTQETMVCMGVCSVKWAYWT